MYVVYVCATHTPAHVCMYMCVHVCVCLCVCACMIFINDADLKCDTCFNYLYVVVHSSLFAIYNYTGCLSPSDSEKAEQPPENSLSSEQVSLLLQKVFTKDRLKAILLQEGEEDQTKVQNLQQDLEGKEWY